MNTPNATAATSVPHIAVLCDRADPRTSDVEARIANHPREAVKWYAPRDADDVDRLVQTGQIDEVIVPDLALLLVAEWDNEIDAAAWYRAGITLTLIEPPPTDALSQSAHHSRTWRAWRRRQRRLRYVGGTILSLIAIAAAFVLLLLANRT